MYRIREAVQKQPRIFWKNYTKLCKVPGIRYGQAFYNSLAIIEPSLAGTIAGTGIDPYYMSNTELRIYIKQLESATSCSEV